MLYSILDKCASQAVMPLITRAMCYTGGLSEMTTDQIIMLGDVHLEEDVMMGDLMILTKYVNKFFNMNVILFGISPIFRVSSPLGVDVGFRLISVSLLIIYNAYMYISIGLGALEVVRALETEFGPCIASVWYMLEYVLKSDATSLDLEEIGRKDGCKETYLFNDVLYPSVFFKSLRFTTG
ncbi:hypothetical protein ACJX0J_006388, partial [Zea mays]